MGEGRNSKSNGSLAGIHPRKNDNLVPHARVSPHLGEQADA